MLDLTPPLQLWLPQRPAIMRVAEKHLLNPSYLPVNREQRRSALSQLVGKGAISKEQAHEAVVFLCPPPFMKSGAAGPTFVALSTLFQSSGTNIVIDKPTGTADGDLMVAICWGQDNANTITEDTGWTQVRQRTATPSLVVAYKIAASEGSNYTFTASVSGRTKSVITTYRGALFDLAGTVNAPGTGNDIVAPSITMTGAGVLLCSCATNNNVDGTFTTPTGMTSISSSAGNSVAPSYNLFSQSVASGATGTRTSTPSGNTPAGLLVGVKAV